MAPVNAADATRGGCLPDRPATQNPPEVTMPALTAAPFFPSQAPATPASEPPGAERPVRVRIATELPALCRAEGAEPGCGAVIRDVSAGGLDLHADRAFGPGALLLVQLAAPHPSGAWALPPLRVLYVRPDGGRSWLLGGQFARPLADEELEALLAERPQGPGARSRG